MSNRLLVQSALPGALALLLAACGSDDLSPIDAPDAGGTKADAGTKPDAGTTPDAGEVPDAGTPERDLVVTSRSSQDPRRGPIVLSFRLDDPDGDVATGHAIEIRQADESWAPATVTVIEETGTSASYLWDSFADIDQDMRVAMRIVARDPDGDVTLPFEMEVRNQPDTDRLVVVAHGMKNLPTGGASDLGTEVSVLLWDGLGGGVVGQPRRMDVGTGPRKVRAAAHGRAFLVTEERAGTLSILTAPLLADTSRVVRAHTLTLPAGTPYDAQWSDDGRFLFVLGTKGETANAPALWKYTPSEDLTRWDDVQPLAMLPGPPMRFDVAPNGDFVIFCGSGGQGLGKVLRYDADGNELGRVEADYGPANGLALTPAGDFALMTSDLFGYDVRQFSLAGSGFSLVGAPLGTIRSPDSIVFHPASAARRAIGLISNADGNGVTPIVVTPTGIDVKPMVRGLPLATDMDLIERGLQAGTVLVSTVTTVSRVEFTAAPAAVVKGVAWNFGDATTSITHGLAIQR